MLKLARTLDANVRMEANKMVQRYLLKGRVSVRVDDLPFQEQDNVNKAIELIEKIVANKRRGPATITVLGALILDFALLLILMFVKLNNKQMFVAIGIVMFVALAFVWLVRKFQDDRQHTNLIELSLLSGGSTTVRDLAYACGNLLNIQPQWPLYAQRAATNQETESPPGEPILLTRRKTQPV